MYVSGAYLLTYFDRAAIRRRRRRRSLRRPSLELLERKLLLVGDLFLSTSVVEEDQDGDGTAEQRSTKQFLWVNLMANFE